MVSLYSTTCFNSLLVVVNSGKLREGWLDLGQNNQNFVLSCKVRIHPKQKKFQQCHCSAP